MSLPSHHRPEGGFRNPWSTAEMHGFLDFLKWTLVERRQTPRRPDPDPAVFTRADPSYVTPRADPEQLSLPWIGNTIFFIQTAGLTFLTDRMGSGRPSPVLFAGPRRGVAPGVDFARLPPIDAVV